MAFCCLLLYKAFKRGGLVSVNTANTESSENEERSPIIFYYDELDGLEYLWPRLEELFRQTGHTRQILFREYDSYKELPDAGCISAVCASDRIPGLLKNSIARMAVNGNEK